MTDSQADRSDAAIDPAGGVLLIIAIFVIAICGLVYELIAGTLSSYLIGDSVTQFSLVIGLFLTAMGIGSYLSRFIKNALLARLILIESVVGLVGGLSAIAGFAAFALTDAYVPILLSLVLAIGVLVGLEIPLVVRILKDVGGLRITLANVFAADYLGALAASLLFPFVLLPHVGLMQAGAIMGLLNVAVAVLLMWRFRQAVRDHLRSLGTVAVASSVALIVCLVFSARLVSAVEARLYQDEIIHAADSQYQRIVVTRWRDDIRLYLNGHLQFSTVDEYRYHESLVHPAMALAERRDRVLILGGGDGLALREVLLHDGVQHVDVVDIDPAVTTLFTGNPLLADLNGRAFHDERVTVHHADAMRYLEQADQLYDVVLMDLPDPSDPHLGKLYSRTFFSLIGRRLSAGGSFATQATSPFRSREAFWCVHVTIASARWGMDGRDGFAAKAYHTVVPTFGTWGFVMAATRDWSPDDIQLAVRNRFLTDDVLAGMFVFPADQDRVETDVSTLDDPVVYRLYREGYHRYLD